MININALKQLPVDAAAEIIATHAHKGQFRRDGITPYIEHPRAVANSLINIRLKAVAWLHDVLEDTSITTFDLLVNGIPGDIVDAVEILTKQPKQDYGKYLKLVKSNWMAKAVKIADMKANLADSPTIKQVQKYTQGLSFLQDEAI